MIKNTTDLVLQDVINFGSAKDKKLGRVTLVATLNKYIKLVEGKCVKSGNPLEMTSVNLQPIHIFDESYVAHYLST